MGTKKKKVSRKIDDFKLVLDKNQAEMEYGGEEYRLEESIEKQLKF